jgi:hypothetical protein
MKSLLLAAATAFALPLFAAPVSGPQKCNRCIQFCNVNSKDDAEARSCLNRCLRQPFCSTGFELPLDTPDEATCERDFQFD